MSDASELRENEPDEKIAKWVNEVLPQAVVYARSLVRDIHTAEDIVHDCICRLLAKQNRYDLTKDGFWLLLRSISNASIDRIRKAKPRSLDTFESDERDAFVEVDRFAIDPSSLAMNKELENAIEQGLQNLPIQQRAALELKGLGLRLAEIAESLEVSESNAGVLLHRARAAMARELAEWRKVD